MSKRNIVHVESPAANVESAAKFYQELFGWKMQHIPDFNYTMWADGSGFGGGSNVASEENPVGKVLVYIDSDNIEAEKKKAAQLGGKVLREKTEIPGSGWFGIFQDTEANVIAIYTSMNPKFNQ